LSSIRPSDQVFTGVYEPSEDLDSIIGQIYQSQAMTSAHLNYLLLTDESDPKDLIVLLEGLIHQAGLWGAKQVVADLAINATTFPQFRQAGFSVLAKQRVFKSDAPENDPAHLTQPWRIWSSADIVAMRSLYFALVPPLIQPIEPLTRRHMLGLVHYDEKGILQAYADLVYGPAGVWVLPVVDPQTKQDTTDLLAQLLLDLPDVNGRPIYIAARSYQPWVEQALENLSLAAGPEQALLVRYIAMRQWVKAEFPFASIENGNPEPTVPLTSIKNNPK